MKRLGVFGGTFDPIHLGHMRSAEEVREALALDQVIFIPAARPPHKGTGRVSPYRHRLMMTTMATNPVPGFGCSDVETRIPGPSYSVKTLRQLREDLPEVELYFIVGSDAFLEIKKWWRYWELTSLANLTVITREEGFDRLAGVIKENFTDHRSVTGQQTSFHCPGQGDIILERVTRLEISSTIIRNRVAEGRSIRFLVPDPVMRYMEENQLYKKAPRDQEGDHPLDPKDSKARALEIARAIEDNKGVDVTILDVGGVSAFADFFVIAHGTSTRHVQGMAEKMRQELKTKGMVANSMEGEAEGKWILMDFGDVVVHLFYEPIRDFYDLEGLWHKAPRVALHQEGDK